jgi:hypothetical protein
MFRCELPNSNSRSEYYDNKNLNSRRNHDFFKMLTWTKCSHWSKGMSILTKGLGHEKTCYILLIHLTKMRFSTKCPTKDLVKMAML